MQRFTSAIEQALADKNWYGALTLALTLPDICGKMENPQERSSSGDTKSGGRNTSCPNTA